MTIPNLAGMCQKKPGEAGFLIEFLELLIKLGPLAHPECRWDEIYLGNFTVDTVREIGWKTKRKGIYAYDIYGTPIYSCFPMFIKRAERFPETLPTISNVADSS